MVRVQDPPDGGWGWVIVGCCFMVTVCTRAVTRCISIFFVEFQTHFESDYAATSWIHSLVDCSTMLCAPLGSLVGNRWSCRVSVIVGGLLSSSGLLLSSFASSLEVLYITLGVQTGVGFALCYTPAVSLVGRYFGRRRSLAYGVALSGAGIGTLVLSPVLHVLIESYSWRGALLVLSAAVSNLCVCGALMRPITARPGPEGAEPGAEPGDSELAVKVSSDQDDVSKALSPAPGRASGRSLSCCFLSSREFSFLLLPDFLFLCVSFLFLSSGCSVPFVYLVPYALSVGVARQHAALLMAALGVIDIAGNITFGWIADRKCLRRRRLACYVVAVAMEGVSVVLLPTLRSLTLLAPFVLVFGYFDGAYVALIPVVVGDAVGGRDLASALGVVYFLHAVPYLVSPPIGGWLVDVTGSYTLMFVLSGVMLMASAAVLVAAAGIRRRRRLQPPPAAIDKE